MTRRSTRRGIILLALLAVLSWIMSRGQDEVFNEPINAVDTRLNYALHDFEGRLLDDEGRVNLEIFAPELRNNATSGIGTVLSPEFQIQEEQERWYITAESAIITADREYVSLVGEVNLTRRNRLTGQVLEIRTRDVLLNVTPRTAATESDVVIRQQGDRLNARGMKLDMVSNSFELLNEVNAHYEIP